MTQFNKKRTGVCAHHVNYQNSNQWILCDNDLFSYYLDLYISAVNNSLQNMVISQYIFSLFLCIYVSIILRINYLRSNVKQKRNRRMCLLLYLNIILQKKNIILVSIVIIVLRE